MSEEKKGFTVKDRRFQSEEKEASPAKETGQSASADDSQNRKTRTEGGRRESSLPPLPALDFSTFIFSLNSSVLVHLGILEEPGTGKKGKNLPLAKQTIDLLGVLEDKTRGNLTPDEENMLKNMLHDLRLMYVREKG
jgi:hypothetical protein